MAYIQSSADNISSFDAAALDGRGKELAETYAAGKPFPHIVIDDFLDERVIEQCLQEFPVRPERDSETFDREQERNKISYHPDFLPAKTRALFYAFNARPFLRVIENITGIKQLIPDPHFFGGGFHEIGTGGHLSMHADFIHHRLLNLERRVNVLIYLNRDWKEEYGGQLELWPSDMSACEQSIVPVANRCVIFSTTETSMHGNPQPVAHPGGISRKSIALYYYSATWDGTRQAKTTQFRARPGTGDKTDWKVRVNETMRDFMPPVLSRQLFKLKKGRGKNPDA